MALSDGSCSSAVVAERPFTSTTGSVSANKVLIRACCEHTCRAAVVPVEKQLHSVESHREAVEHSRLGKQTTEAAGRAHSFRH